MSDLQTILEADDEETERVLEGERATNCRECGEVLGHSKHQLDREKAADMCWECWLLLMA
jgi:hypothetical protein